MQNSGNARLRQGCGPAVLLALLATSPESAYVTYKGHVTVEHLRHASSMEKLAVPWEDALHDGLGTEREDGGDAEAPDVLEMVVKLALFQKKGRLVGFAEPGRPLPQVLTQLVVFPFPYPVGVGLLPGRQGLLHRAARLCGGRTSSMGTVASDKGKVRAADEQVAISAESVPVSGQCMGSQRRTTCTRSDKDIWRERKRRSHR